MQSLILIIGFLIIAFSVSLFFIKKWMSEMLQKTKPSEDLIEWLKSVSTRMETSTAQVDQKLTDNMKNFNQRLDKAAFIIAQVQKNIGEFSEIGRSMKDLQELLQSPKLRGNIGETILTELLTQYLPKEIFALQHTFTSGVTVDAIIKTTQGLIPIDAKFPIDNFRKMIREETEQQREKYKKEFVRDVRKHIHDISRKYIQPSEKTVDYALMYIPSEAIFYEIINTLELFEYAHQERVLIVSPMSFYAYLKVILMSHQGQHIEKRAREIATILASLKTDYSKADESLSTLNRHITNAYNQVSVVSKFFIGFGQKLTMTELLEKENETKKLPS
ncbi:MAG TPA: DNA recombination protein RmuC [Patescibacteria group bacterium]|nr:DNA recombination protein RmuC [Patescibacteria group bacterium]